MTNELNNLTSNITSIHGDYGKKWLASLPGIIHLLTLRWELHSLAPVDNMTFNYVAKAMTHDDSPVILKIGCDNKIINDECAALKYFDGNGAVELLADDETFNALLLRQAIPGITLKNLYQSDPDYAMDCYIDTMNKLHARQPSREYRHINDWLQAIDRLSYYACPEDLVIKAKSLKNSLLHSMNKQVFLHGDLHHDNIIQSQHQWLAIDPKGVIGDPEFEIAAFDFTSIPDLAKNPRAKFIIQNRVNMLAQKSHLNPERILNWLFVRLILMAAWQLEDHINPRWAITLASKL